MDVFIYFPPGLEVPRDEIEDAIEACLGARGEVTGGGGGTQGSNVDIELFQPDKGIVAEIRRTLRELGVPAATRLVVDGEQSAL